MLLFFPIFASQPKQLCHECEVCPRLPSVWCVSDLVFLRCSVHTTLGQDMQKALVAEGLFIRPLSFIFKEYFFIVNTSAYQAWNGSSQKRSKASRTWRCRTTLPEEEMYSKDIMGFSEWMRWLRVSSWLTERWVPYNLQIVRSTLSHQIIKEYQAVGVTNASSSGMNEASEWCLLATSEGREDTRYHFWLRASTFIWSTTDRQTNRL